MWTVKPETVPTPDKPALSEQEIERKSKSIIDEFLHINDYKVPRVTGKSTLAAKVLTFINKQELRRMLTINELLHLN